MRSKMSYLFQAQKSQRNLKIGSGQYDNDTGLLGLYLCYEAWECLMVILLEAL